MDNEYYNALPKKRMAAGALILNRSNEILIVKPTYKSTWHIPGGIVELNESPLEACKRELIEEIALDLKIERLLVVDYKSETGQSSESLQFIFYGGVLDDLLIEKITLPPDELEGYKFINPDDIDKYFNESLGKRIKHSYEALKSNTSVYLENHERIDGICIM